MSLSLPWIGDTTITTEAACSCSRMSIIGEEDLAPYLKLSRLTVSYFSSSSLPGFETPSFHAETECFPWLM